MKNILAGLLLTATFAVTSAQTIAFNEMTHDYGTIAKGADGTTFFTVTNTGDKPLIISKVQPACGCTTPEFSQDPIMPGKSAKIKVGYNTSIVSPFQKLIEVYSNDPVNSRIVLNIKGNVTDTAAGDVKMTPAVPAKDAQMSKKMKAVKS